jgi:hypothetical protein
MKPFLEEGRAGERAVLKAGRRLALGAATGMVALAAFVGDASEAQAQQPAWLADRRFSEGPGFRTGNFELHPGIGAEFGYDSNFFRRSDDEGPVGALRFRVTPHFAISTLGPQRRDEDATPPDVEFRGDLGVTYDEYVGVSGPDADQSLMNDQRNLGGLLNLGLKFFSGRPVFGSLNAGISRSITPNNLGDTSISFNRLNPFGNAEIGFAPGGGLFEFAFNYGLQATVFEQSEYGDLTNLNHAVGTRGNWRFLPKSALFYNTTFNFTTYPDAVEKTGSHPVRARVGYNGLVTNYLGILAAGGWGASFYEPTGQEDFDSFIGQVEARFFFTPNAANDPTAASLLNSQMAIGFNRDFYDSFIGTYYEYDRGYLRFSYLFGGTFLLSLEGGAGAVVFPDVTEPVVNPSWTDVKVDAQLLGEYRFTDYFALNGTLRYDHYFSDEDLDVAAGAPAAGSFGQLQWQAFQGFVGARLFY